MIATSKSEFLVQHRTFHRGHAQVTDPLFAVDGFFDPRDLLLVKYEMLRRVRVDHWSVARAAACAALSRTAWYAAEHRWARRGLIGLWPDPPGPRTRTDRTRGRQKRGAVPSRGTRGTRDCGPIGSADTSLAKWFSFCDKGCWLGCGLPLATSHRRLLRPIRCEAMRRVPLPWAATSSPPLSS